MTTYDQQGLSDLEELFNDALEHMSHGEIEEAKNLYKRIIEADPRLPEPYLELAVIVHGEGDLESALIAAKLGLEYLEKGGQWLATVTENVLLAHAKNLVGTLLVEWAQQDERLFDEDAFPRLYNEAVTFFRSAHELDPNNVDARTNAVLHKPIESPG